MTFSSRLGEGSSARQIRPSTRFSFCPSVPAHAAQWALAHLTQELYWKPGHFAVLCRSGATFGPDAFHALDDQLCPELLAKLIHEERDIVDETLTRALTCAEVELTEIVRCSAVETVLNGRLSVACALGGPEFCAAVVAPLLPWGDTPTLLYPVRLENLPKTGITPKQFGQPDFLLLGDRSLVMIEMKVRGGESSAKYGAAQLWKYLNLAAYAFERLNVDRACHLILTARTAPAPFVHRGEWIDQIDDDTGAVSFRPNRFSVVTRAGYREYFSRPTVVQWVTGMLERVPVRRRFYDELSSVEGSVDSWADRLAGQQLRRLAIDAEPRH